jgi:hypothetical protein
VEERAQRPEYHLTARDRGAEVRLRFRLPRGADLEALGGEHPQGTAADRAAVALLGRCVLGIDAPAAGGPGAAPQPAAAVALLGRSARLRAALAERMRRHSALVQRELDTACPECGRPFTATFDPVLSFLSEMLRRRPEFERDVHLLSLHYHWPLSEILAMPRPRRRRYVELLCAHTEPEPVAMAGR